VLFTLFSRKALVMHSVSDHSLNIPSKIEVERYIGTLSKAEVLERGNTCTVPVQFKIREGSATGIAFGNTAVVILSMAPKGMDDVPNNVRLEIEQYSSQLGFNYLLIIDSHNSLGDHLTKADCDNLVSAAKQCMKVLKNAKQLSFKIGFANSDDIYYNVRAIEDLGQSGIAAVVIEVAENRYVLGWADSNNMQNGIHEHIISMLSDNGIKMIEVCTSDTHSTSGKRTRQGYYALGNVSKPDKVAEMYLQVSKKSIQKTGFASFELLLAESNIRVMGKNQFDDYSSALDKSMSITKIFLGFTLAIFISMMITS